jgi:geranylgeranylglycerol-phosphate geranylgeranyltransferase
MKLKIAILFLLIMSTYSFRPTNMLLIKMSENTKPIHMKKINSYVKITRPEGLPYEFALPLFGSYLATKSIETLLNPYAILMGIISAIIASNSMVINDYYDYKLGTDKDKSLKVLNKKDLTTEEVVHFSTYLGLLSYYLSSLIDNTLIRHIISNTIIVTYLYTPIFKNIPLLKNVIVSLIITQSPLTGALIVNGDIKSVIPAMVYLFNFIMWQELILDIIDLDGDKKNNIKTIPVLYGYKKANIIGLGFLILGSIIPYGLSIKFILLQLPLILINSYAIKTNKILKKQSLKISKIIMLISGIYMCCI